MPSTKRLRLLSLGLCFLFLCTSCATTPRFTEMQLLCTFYPAYVVTARIAQDIEGVRVDCLTAPQAGLLSSYLLSTPDYRAIEACSVLIGMGGGLESFLDGVTGAAICPVIALNAQDPQNAYPWLSPAHYLQLLAGAAAALSELDSTHAAQYEANLRAEAAEVSTRRMALAQAGLAGKRCVSLHPAAAALAHEAGMEVTLTISRDPGYQPGEGDLQDLRALLAGHAGEMALIENTAPARVLQTLREEGLLPVRLETLCTGTKDENTIRWIDAFDANLAALKGCAIP
ncbi:MAG: zinc ABC transporter substrate-binding protein [Clostridia bacterium]